MSKLINQAKEVEIPIVFHNYKLLENKEFVLKGSNIYFVQGPNGVGKTSFLKALTSSMIAKDDTTEKVTRGEEEGYFECTIPSATGEEITIRHEFTNEKSKFIAIDSKGNKISNVTDIRKLFNYTPINISEFFAMSNSAEGRRKQRDIILKLLPETTREEFNQLDLQEEHYYTKRTEVNVALKNAKSNLDSIVVSEEDKALVGRLKEAQDLLEEYRNIHGVVAKIEIKQEQINGIYEEIKFHESTLERLKAQVKPLLEEVSILSESIKKTVAFTPQEINERISKGSAVVQKISEIKARLSIQDENAVRYATLEKLSREYTDQIDSFRKKKEYIMANSNLPVQEVSFENGYLTIDGFQFNENQVCESDGVLILANILAKINPGPIQIIGDASILDNDKLQRLNEIAEDNNKIMFVDEVVRSANEMVVVGYEEIAEKLLNDSIDLVAKVPKKKGKTLPPMPIIDKIDAHYEDNEKKDDETKNDIETLF